MRLRARFSKVFRHLKMQIRSYIGALGFQAPICHQCFSDTEDDPVPAFRSLQPRGLTHQHPDLAAVRVLDGQGFGGQAVN